MLRIKQTRIGRWRDRIVFLDFPDVTYAVAGLASVEETIWTCVYGVNFSPSTRAVHGVMSSPVSLASFLRVLSTINRVLNCISNNVLSSSASNIQPSN
jgi:hypothetical protein